MSEPSWLRATRRSYAAVAEFAPVLRPGGELLGAFQVGTERISLEHAYGHAVSLVVHRRPPEKVAELLVEAGLDVHAELLRGPEHGEKCSQGFLLARR